MQMIGDRLDRKETVGFDYLRIILAVAVMGWHHVVLSVGGSIDADLARTPWAIPVRLILPLFFALSGFLVASSLVRLGKLKPFLINRGLRIAPALFVEVVLSALLLGPIFTNLELYTYFNDPHFLLYLANVVGWIHLQLPGVFPTSSMAGTMNASLWTVPYELECYIALAALFLIARKRLSWALWAALLLGSLSLVVKAEVAWDHVLAFRRGLVLCFLAGNLIYIHRHRLPTSNAVIIVLTGVASLLMLSPVTAAFSPLVLAYLAAALGCTNPPKSAILRSGDYSYGIYLYAFPMQQCAIALLGPGHPIVSFLLAFVAVCGFAFFSWHVVEKPTLRLKTVFDKGNVQAAGAQNVVLGAAR